MLPLWVASSSPRRHDLLSQYRVPFIAIPNLLAVEPSPEYPECGIRYAVRCTKQKVTASYSGYSGLIMGVDTVVEWQGRILGKPADSSQALYQLQAFMGTTHRVISTCVLWDTHRNIWLYCVDYAIVSVSLVPESILIDYIHRYPVLDKAGGYGIQDNPSFIHIAWGDRATIMGLPLRRLLKLLYGYGIVNAWQYP